MSGEDGVHLIEMHEIPLYHLSTKEQGPNAGYIFH